MEYNIYQKDLDEYERAKLLIVTKLEKINSDLSKLDSIEEKRQAVAKAHGYVSFLKIKCQDHKNTISYHKMCLRKIEQELDARFPSKLTRLLSKPAKRLKQEIDCYRDKVSESESYLNASRLERNSHCARIVELEKEIAKIESTDVNKLNSEIWEHQNTLKAVERCLTIARHNYNLLQKQISSLVSEIEIDQKELRFTQIHLDRALEIKNVDFPRVEKWQKRELHEELEKISGSGSPNVAIRRLEGRVKGLEHSIRKREQAIKIITKRLTRKIERVYVDGNNLCHTRTSFIGIGALRALVTKLSEITEVVVFFDNSILKSYRDQYLMGIIEKDGASVFITSDKADGIMLPHASESENYYVISNDWFSDFPHQDVVKKKRVFKHNIYNGRVIVEDLNIDIPYESERMGDSA